MRGRTLSIFAPLTPELRRILCKPLTNAAASSGLLLVAQTSPSSVSTSVNAREKWRETRGGDEPHVGFGDDLDQGCAGAV